MTDAVLIFTDQDAPGFVAAVERSTGVTAVGRGPGLARFVFDEQLVGDVFENDYDDENGLPLSEAAFLVTVHGPAMAAFEHLKVLGVPMMLVSDGVLVAETGRAAA